MNHWSPWIGIALLVAVVAAAGLAWWWQRRWRRRNTAMQALLEGADRLEADIKKCRSLLARAHAAVAVAPQVPAAGSADAQDAIDQALRSLLAHRLWIRDHAPQATQAELDTAVDALTHAHQAVRGQLAALIAAQQELDAAVREHAS